MALSGKVPGSAVATTRRRAPSGPHPPRLASAAHQVSACPSRKVLVTGCQSPGSAGPPQARARAPPPGVRVRGRGPGPATRPQRHHERQPGLRQLAAEPVLVPVGAVRDDRPEREPRRPSPDRQVRAYRQLGPEPRVVLPLREVPRRGVRHRVHRVVDPLISPHRGHGDHPVVGLAVPAQPPLAYVRGLVPSLRSPLSSITSTPPPCGAVAGSPQQLQPAGGHRLRIPHRLGQEELQPLYRRQLRPGHRLRPGQRVSVLFRSRGASSPARYSRNPRRCATCVNRSSKPGRVPLQRTRRRRTRHQLGHRSSPASNSPGTYSQTTAEQP